MQKSNKSFLFSIFLTAFLDMLGIGIIIPIIPAIFYTQKAIHFVGVDTESQIRWAYCMLMGSYSIMMFFGAPILGALSDRYGRKRIIQIALIGSSIGYAIFGIALAKQSLFLLFLSRIIPGFFGGSLSVIFSAISDVSTPAEKPKNFALIGMAFGLGFISGPIIGGLLSDKDIVSWFTLSTPFVLATFLALVNFLVVHFNFKETLKLKKHTPLSLLHGFVNVKKAFGTSNLRVLFSITFLTTLGFSFYTQFFSVFMYEKFHVTQKTVGLIFGWVGIWLIFTQGFLVRRYNSKMSAIQILTITLLVMGSCIICMIFPDYIWGILICNVFIAVSQGFNSPNLLSIVSKQANEEQQGEILGINQSMQSLAQIVPTFIVGFFGESLSSFPFIFGGSSIIFAWVIFNFFYKKNHL